MNSKNIFLAISMITYNHEQFVAQAIQGILIQKTNFIFKLFVTNDCSKDLTGSICKNFAKLYPDKIFYEEFVDNKGAIENWVYNLNKCFDSGAKYIAICEGDDYWTDPLKLQKQVDFLEKNDNVNLVHTDFDWFNVLDGSIIKNYYKSINYELDAIYDLRKFFLKPKVRTLTICFRSICLKGYKEIINPEWTVGDTSLLLYVIKNKQIGFINESTGLYRRGIDTTSSNRNGIKQFEYWKNASSKVKFFFYNYYELNDAEVKKKLKNDYYDSMFEVAIQAKKYQAIIRSFFYKCIHFRLSILDFKQLVHGLILNR